MGSNGISYAAELRVSEIAFDAESFSVYGVVYTVDFTYDGFTYCIEGGSSICLSELAQILGLYETDLDKAFSVGNVSNVSFTDYDLVKIEKQADGDWLLISLAPFTSEETLTIEMNDGVTFIVDVTDAAGDQWDEGHSGVHEHKEDRRRGSSGSPVWRTWAWSGRPCSPALVSQEEKKAKSKSK